MSLRFKTLTVIGITVATLVVVLYYVSSTLHMAGYERLETESARQNVGRVVNAISDDQDQISRITNDYARWDDTYSYVATGDRKYETVNLVGTTFTGLRLNVMLFVHKSGRIVFAGAWDEKSHRVARASSSLLKCVSPGSLLLRHPTVTSSKSGLLLLPEGPIIVSAKPILTSEGTGPIRGTAIFGRYLDSNEVNRLAHLTDLRIVVSDLSAKAALPAPVSDSLAKPGAVAVQPLSEDTIAGYAVLKDAFGKPALLLRADMPRRIHQQGRATLGYYVLWFLGAGLAFCVVTLLAIERLVLSRLACLNKAVVDIGASGELSGRVRLAGNDELSSLSAAIDTVFGTLEQSQRDLQAAHSELEMRVHGLDHVAHHDYLTNLPNRLLFADRLTQSLNSARRYQQSVAVMFLDLDRFKTINDTLGHSFGDILLKAVADRLTSQLREVDTVARMGGDEFTIISERVTGTQETAAVARKVLSALSEPFVLGDRELFVSASIGISVYPEDGSDVETLVRNADTAMYRAKEQGRCTFQFYTDALNATAVERMELEHGLRRALERNELMLYYQPHVSLMTGEPMGSEALVRWQRPGIGIISPAQFIHLAEETGLIVPMTEWILNTACAQNKAWQDAGYPAMDIGVNISTRLLRQRNLAKTVERALNNSGLAPNYLTLELTESVLMEDPDAAGEVLGNLKAMGVRLSIDDFGTGYSSLSYLKRFPVDTVKIDQSFVREIVASADDAIIAEAIVAMAHSLRLNVIAEGVETLQQLEFLRSIKCDEMQGYFVSRPVPVEEFTAYLDQIEQDITKRAA